MFQDSVRNPGYSDECDNCCQSCYQCPIYWEVQGITPEEIPVDYENDWNVM